jgi:hypothetical protein
MVQRPPFGLSARANDPPDAVAGASTIANPRPVPGLVVSPRQNRRVAFRFSSSDRPGPWSLHAALARTDRTLWLRQVTAVASIAAVAWSLMYRLANRRQSRRQTAGRLHEREADATDRKRLPDPVAVASDEIDPIDTFATVSGVGEPNGSVDS